MADGVVFASGVVAIGSSGFGTPNLASDGAVGAPSYSFASAPTTGWYLSGGVLRYSINGNFSGQFSQGSWTAGVLGTTDLGAAATAFKRIYFDFTNTGTIGAVTISKASGRVNIAAAATSVVVTNTLVTAASKVFCTIAQADATAVLKNVVPAAGSFTITLNAAATANCAVDFFVVNAD